MTTHPVLDLQLRQLKLPGIAAHYAQVAHDAGAAQLSYPAYLQALTTAELDQRAQVRQRRCLQHAQFPVVKELADFDWTALPSLNPMQVRDLAAGHYLRQAENVLLVGNPGLGKTHLATALGVAACRQGERVRFWNTAGLVTDLLAAQQTHTLTRMLRQILTYRLIILDELGFVPLSPTGAQLLFQFCATLHERVALIITTNLRFADWTQVFGNESLTAALLDRVTARAHIIACVGDSYRVRQRQQRQLTRHPAHDFGGDRPQAPDG